MSKTPLLLIVVLQVISVVHPSASAGVTANSATSAFVPPNSSALRYIGRFDRSLDAAGNRVMNFDNNGCEIAFRVQGTRQVFVHFEQQISGPHGWYKDHKRKKTAWAKHLRMLDSVRKAPPIDRRHEAQDHDGHDSRDGAEAALLQSSADIQSTADIQGGADMQSASEIQTTMELAGSQPHEFLVYVDGVPQSAPIDGSPCRGCTFDTRLARNGTVAKHRVAYQLSAGPHEIRIFKTSEPEWSSRQPTPNWISFHGLSLDHGGEVLPPAQPRRKRRIEFLGDSITSGYCNLCHSGADVVERQGSYAIAWPNLVCDALGAECHSLALAGFGIARNCCGDNDVRMPELYTRGVATDSNSQWNFESWVPDVLVVHLGSNDHLWESSSDPDAYVKQYVELVVATGNTYGPHLNVFLGCGPTDASAKACPHVETVVAEVQKHGIKAHFLDQRGFLQTNYGHHCCFHPGALQSQAMAQDAATLIAQTAGWV